MIITIEIDTDTDKDGIVTLVNFVKAMGRTDVTAEKPRIVVNDIQAAARLRTAGEKVIYKSEPKKRGRPKKEKV
jgi:hypothetical protein